jgi:hypothetical protein
MNLLRAYGRLLVEKPIRTKCITSFITFGGGDLLCQYLETVYSGRKEYDWLRAARQASFGLCITPYLHLQFSIIMPYLFPNGSRFQVLKMVAYDQTLGATVFISLFFSYIDLMSGKSFNQMKEELKVKFLPTLYANWKIWPALMLVNFGLVPAPWRVLYTNIMGIFWNGYLSYVQNVKSKGMIKAQH